MNFIAKLFALKAPALPSPSRYPDFNNIPAWMEEKVAYFAATCPDKLFYLFCPSMGDYLPLNVTAGASQERFYQNVEVYKALKAKYPEAAKEAKENVRDWSIFNGGPRDDYP